MQGGESSVDGLKTLAAQGLLVYLDDFGTGYSSLTRLARLPLTGIKLDRGFVARRPATAVGGSSRPRSRSAARLTSASSPRAWRPTRS